MDVVLPVSQFITNNIKVVWYAVANKASCPFSSNQHAAVCGIGWSKKKKNNINMKINWKWNLFRRCWTHTGHCKIANNMKCRSVSCWIGWCFMKYGQRLSFHFLLQFGRVRECQTMKTADRNNQNDYGDLCFKYRYRQDRWIGKFVSNVIIDQIDVQTDLRQFHCVMARSPW